MSPASRRALLAAAVAALAVGACARPAARPPDPGALRAPEADSITIGLWHMDETGGTRVADSGPFGLEGTAGLDTRTDFGRLRRSRVFVASAESFVLVPYNPVFDEGRGFTVEAWIDMTDYGQYELTAIACRWTTQANEQSWMFGVVGSQLKPPLAALASPGYFDGLVTNLTRGQLLFAFVPQEAGAPRVFASTGTIELGRWEHVAATFDGEVVRLYLDGRLDSQFATAGRIRPSPAPLLVGNFFEPRTLTDFGGDLRPSAGADLNPYYAFLGSIDELRLSNAARAAFPGVRR